MSLKKISKNQPKTFEFNIQSLKEIENENIVTEKSQSET